MNAHEVVQVLTRAGLSVSVTPDRGLKVAPASKLTPPLRDLVQASKPALIDLLTRWPEPANDASPSTPPTAPPAPAPDQPPPDPDRHCWPHTEAMNTVELHALQSHTTRLQGLGLGLDAAERLADRTVWAQRQGDARRTCLQCCHLSGQAGARYCRNALQAGIGLHGPVVLLPVDWVTLPQRCDGFKA